MNTQIKKIGIESHSIIRYIVDHKISKTTGSEFKLLMYLYRHTLGSRFQEKSISLNEFVEETGISKNTVIKSLQDLVEKKIIEQKTRKGAHYYQLNISTIVHPYRSQVDNVRYVITNRSGENQKIDPPMFD